MQAAPDTFQVIAFLCGGWLYESHIDFIFVFATCTNLLAPHVLKPSGLKDHPMMLRLCLATLTLQRNVECCRWGGTGFVEVHCDAAT